MKSGIYKGMHNKEYDSVEAERSTTLKTYYHDSVKRYQTTPKKDSDSLRFGKALHTMVLEPHLKSEIAIKLAFPKGGKGITKEIKERNIIAESEFLAKHGNEWVTSEELVKICKMSFALRESKNNDIYEIMKSKNTDNEVSAFGSDPFTGLPCKARIDKLFLDKGIWLDYKTTAYAEPKKFLRDAIKYDYDLSAAFHADVLEWAASESNNKEFQKIHTWLWLIQEKEYPYLSNLIEVPDIMIEEGRRKYREGLIKKKEFLDGFEHDYNGMLINKQYTQELLPNWYVNQCNYKKSI